MRLPCGSSALISLQSIGGLTQRQRQNAQFAERRRLQLDEEGGVVSDLLREQADSRNRTHRIASRNTDAQRE